MYFGIDSKREKVEKVLEKPSNIYHLSPLIDSFIPDTRRLQTAEQKKKPNLFQTRTYNTYLEKDRGPDIYPSYVHVRSSSIINGGRGE